MGPSFRIFFVAEDGTAQYFHSWIASTVSVWSFAMKHWSRMDPTGFTGLRSCPLQVRSFSYPRKHRDFWFLFLFQPGGFPLICLRSNGAGGRTLEGCLFVRLDSGGIGQFGVREDFCANLVPVLAVLAKCTRRTLAVPVMPASSCHSQSGDDAQF